ncbi:MAG: AroM family protein [Promethearchaeia archaeon]
MKKVGMITIGQAPRSDVMADIDKILGPDIQDVHCGALDDLSMTEINALEPSPGEELLVTRLRDGTEVELGHNKIIEQMSRCIKRLTPEVDLIAILCTGELPELESTILMVKPSNVMSHLLQSLLHSGKLGVLIPNPAQKEVVEKKWGHKGLEVFVQSLSPYQEEDRQELGKIAHRFRSGSVDLIVLDCIGYSQELSDFLKKETHIPVLLSRTIVARVIRELL